MVYTYWMFNKTHYKIISDCVLWCQQLVSSCNHTFWCAISKYRILVHNTFEKCVLHISIHVCYRRQWRDRRRAMQDESILQQGVFKNMRGVSPRWDWATFAARRCGQTLCTASRCTWYSTRKSVVMNQKLDDFMHYYPTRTVKDVVADKTFFFVKRSSRFQP
jgi:hypothetical protein